MKLLSRLKAAFPSLLYAQVHADDAFIFDFNRVISLKIREVVYSFWKPLKKFKIKSYALKSWATNLTELTLVAPSTPEDTERGHGIDVLK